MAKQSPLRRMVNELRGHASTHRAGTSVYRIADAAKTLGLSALALTLSWTAAAAPTYSELRDAEAKKIEKLEKEKADEAEISAAMDKAYESLGPVLLSILPKIRFSRDFSESHRPSPNLFLEGYADSACVDGAHYTVKRRKDNTTFEVFVTTRSLVSDAKARGSSGDLAEIFCTDAAHEGVGTIKYSGTTKYPLHELKFIAEAQDDMNGANGLIAEVEFGQTLLYIKEPIPENHPSNAKCAKLPRKQQGDCFESVSLTQDLQVKIAALVNGLSIWPRTLSIRRDTIRDSTAPSQVNEASVPSSPSVQ